MPKIPPLQETNTLGDLLKYEAPNLYSRERRSVAEGEVLALGSVIGVIAATDEIAELDPSANDGREIAVGVSLVSIDASAGLRTDGLTVERHAIVTDHALVWSADLTDEARRVAVRQLVARGVLIRTGA